MSHISRGLLFCLALTIAVVLACPAWAAEGCNCHSPGVSVIRMLSSERQLCFASVEGGLDCIKVYQVMPTIYTKRWCICYDTGETGNRNCTYFEHTYEGSGPDVEFLEATNCLWKPGGPSSATCANNGGYPPCSAVSAPQG